MKKAAPQKVRPRRKPVVVYSHAYPGLKAVIATLVRWERSAQAYVGDHGMITDANFWTGWRQGLLSALEVVRRLDHQRTLVPNLPWPRDGRKR